jgi:hypothetical protein
LACGLVSSIKIERKGMEHEKKLKSLRLWSDGRSVGIRMFGKDGFSGGA